MPYDTLRALHNDPRWTRAVMDRLKEALRLAAQELTVLFSLRTCAEIQRVPARKWYGAPLCEPQDPKGGAPSGKSGWQTCVVDEYLSSRTCHKPLYHSRRYAGKRGNAIVGCKRSAERRRQKIPKALSHRPPYHPRQHSKHPGKSAKTSPGVEYRLQSHGIISPFPSLPVFCQCQGVSVPPITEPIVVAFCNFGVV